MLIDSAGINAFLPWQDNCQALNAQTIKRANFTDWERMPERDTKAAEFLSQIISAVGSEERIFKGNTVSLKRRSFSILSADAGRKYGRRRRR